METSTLIKMIRQDSCNGCTYQKECEESGKGCLLSLKAADMLETAAAEMRAVFSLGQKDMQAAIGDMLEAMADGTQGIVCTTLIDAADRVRKLEVSG